MFILLICVCLFDVYIIMFISPTFVSRVYRDLSFLIVRRQRPKGVPKSSGKLELDFFQSSYPLEVILGKIKFDSLEPTAKSKMAAKTSFAYRISNEHFLFLLNIVVWYLIFLRMMRGTHICCQKISNMDLDPLKCKKSNMAAISDGSNLNLYYQRLRLNFWAGNDLIY